MSVRMGRSTRSQLGWGAAALGTALLVALAVRAGTTAADARAAFVLLDVSIGIAFVIAGSVARGSVAERVLVVAVGMTWLAGSVWSSLGSLHQAVVAVALLGFPSARIRGPIQGLLTVAAVVVGLGVVPQLGVAALFAVIAGWTAIAAGSHRRGSAFPAVSAAGIAGALAMSWTATRFNLGAFDPRLALVVYEVVLLLIAGAFPLAIRSVARARRLADDVVADLRLEGLEGVAVALRGALGDPSLSVYRWDRRISAYVDDRGRSVDRSTTGGRWMPVDGSDGPLAAVSHTSDQLDDRLTASAVVSAVALTVTNLRLREELMERLVELEASRSRILEAADVARTRFTEELRDDVEPSLRAARSELSGVAVTDPEAAAALDVVVGELAATSATLADLVMGVPPTSLGAGRLHAALEDLARRCSVPMSLTVAEDATATADLEATLYYVVAEAVTNAVKHARATHIAVDVERRDGTIVASISDDGRGGADPSGSGLQGLADRLAVRGGRLRVESPPGAGTAVVASIPS